MLAILYSSPVYEEKRMQKQQCPSKEGNNKEKIQALQIISLLQLKLVKLLLQNGRASF